ncbi:MULTISPECIES: TolC family protein [Croceitalea]|uniref:TolC family protein n=1 Tax=Croceitalea vernalis TaxID=3075599 RepID=A0ABU3BD66_9FLAO|nr:MULTISPECIES: TolC family protein [unclassified Croceitalea]MDT0538619.1 TolC family protein [Croceitalea sp. P059]MDT0620404.1 TolC family protein [Croceitalea sp. P007]
MNLKKIFFILSFASWFTTIAQQVWSLEECVDYAIENNLQLNDFEYTEQSNKETYRQSVRNLLPNINGYADYNISFGRQVNPNDNSISNTEFFSNNYSISGSFDVFQGFQKINSIKASKFLYRAAKEESVQQKYLLAFRVMRAFYDIQFIEGLIIISEEQVEISKTNFELVKKQIEVGLMAGADLYEAESLLLADELLLTQNNNRLAAAKLTLIQAMNLKGETDILIRPEIENSEKEENLKMTSDSVFNTAMTFIPLIKAQELRVKAAKKQVAIARGNLAPSIAIQGGYGTGYFETITDTLGVTIPFRSQFRDNTNQFVGVSLNVPISNGWSGRSRIKQQKIALARAKNNFEIQEQELYQLIQQLVQEYNALNTEVLQTAKRSNSQELAFEIAQKRYEKGLINAIELGRAKTLFATAQNENLQVRLRLKVNKSTLDFYNNLSIFNIN